MEKKNVVLSSAEPITDGGRSYNIVYAFGCIIGFLIVFIATKFNIGMGLIGLGAGALLWWGIKQIICEFKCSYLREMTFACSSKIPYAKLIQGLQPLLIPMGMVIEKGKEGNPVITYQRFIYDVYYNEENTFTVWWRKSVAGAFLSVRSYIYYYRMASIAYGLIAYHVQQLCTNYSSESQGAEQAAQETKQQGQAAEQEQGTKQTEHTVEQVIQEMGQAAEQSERAAEKIIQETGQEQTAGQETHGQVASYCPRCGTPCKEIYKFCIKCGTDLRVS